MNKGTLIAFGGRRFSGKSTAERILVDKYYFQPIRFSDRLREIFSEIAGVDVIEYNKWDQLKDLQEINGRSLRGHLCDLADSIKSINPSYFTDFAKRRISTALKSYNVVAPDIRFQHELEAIKSIGGITVKIERNLAEDTFIHNSENGVEDGWDFIISNNGSILDLEEEIKKILG